MTRRTSHGPDVSTPTPTPTPAPRTQPGLTPCRWNTEGTSAGAGSGRRTSRLYWTVCAAASRPCSASDFLSSTISCSNSALTHRSKHSGRLERGARPTSFSSRWWASSSYSQVLDTRWAWATSHMARRPCMTWPQRGHATKPLRAYRERASCRLPPVAAVVL
jgi:hypothetical protein